MTITTLLRELAKLNIKINLRDDVLSISAPKGALTRQLRDQLKNSKADIKQWLLKNREIAREAENLPEIIPDPANRFEVFPFSDLQVGFYMANDPYMEFQVQPHYYLELDRPDLDINRYERAWNKAVQRHRGEIVLVNENQQLQQLKEIPAVTIKRRDLRHLPTEEALMELQQLREQQMRQEQPLDRWPWFELQVSLWHENGVEKKRIHFNNNNFYSDGFGTSQLLAEIDAYYADPKLTLPSIELTYRDAIVALEKLADSEVGQAARNYWLDRLSDLPPPPELPLLPGMERRCRSRLQRREQILPAEIWKGFKGNAIRFGLTPSNAIFAVYAEVIAAWSGSQHFILSNMMTRRLRLHPDITQILGNFASLYPLEVDLRGNLPFKDRAQRMQEQVFRDANHLQWGGMQVMQALNQLKGELGTVPCPFVIGSGIFMESYKKPNFSCLETSQTLLDHQFWELEDGRYYYVWDLLEEYFPAGLIDSMWQGLEGLIRRLAGIPSVWHDVVFNLLPEQELEQRNLVNQTSDVQLMSRVPLNSVRVLPDLLRTAADTHPDKVVVAIAAGALSYQELHSKSLVLAAHLDLKAIDCNVPIAVLMDRGENLLLAVMAVLYAGAPYVPIDPSLPEERINYLIGNSMAQIVLTQRKYACRLPLSESLRLLCVDELDGDLDSQGTLPQVTSTDLAYLIYTSGSTGKPKGVMIDHRAVLNTVLDINRRFNVNSDDTFFGVSSFSFDLSVYDLFGSLAAAATLVYPQPDAALNPAHWLELLHKEQVTVWNSAPPLMGLLVEAAQRQAVRLPALRLVLLSGDWIPLGLPDAIRAIAPNAEMVSLGGATEASIWSIYYPISDVKKEWGSIPYGYPLTNQRWHIRDFANRPTPLWTSGELYIAGDGLAQGYWQDPDKTTQNFIFDSLSGERLYRTGDRGRYLPNGCIEFLGRTDSQVKIQGHRIELGEIEAALLEHPAVKEVIVMAQTLVLNQASANSKQLVAYVIYKPGEDKTKLDSQQLRLFLQEKLPVYMVPGSWLMLDQFPVTHNGKLDRRALSALEIEQSHNDSDKSEFIAPRNVVEQHLADIWLQILGKSKIGVQDDFFDELGGQSFDAVRTLSLIKGQFGKLLSLGDIWQDRTIEALALRLDESRPEQVSSSLIYLEMGNGQRPYFFVHPAGGHVICYAELGRCLQRPVYGFQAKGVDGHGTPLDDISQIANRYITEMRQLQKTGPYTIGGWSSGGIIAFDMAAQLEQAGESVDQVIILDCPSPLEHAAVDDPQLLSWFVEDLAMDLPLGRRAYLDIQGMDDAEQLTAVIDRFGIEWEGGLDAQQLLPIFKVFKSIVRAVRNYHPNTINAAINLIRARDGAVSEFSNHPHGQREDWGWGLVSDGEVSTANVPGSHHTLLNLGYVEAIAELINASSRTPMPNRTVYSPLTIAR